MKKFITLVLVLAFALGLAAPAMAFTGADKDNTDYAYELAIKLVDVTDGYVSVNFNAPPTNRGYLKNEVVCAVVSLYVPKGADLYGDFSKMVFSGTNVDLYQSQNFYAHVVANNVGTLAFMSSNAWKMLYNNPVGTNYFSYSDMYTANEITLSGLGLDKLEIGADGAAQTYHFAIFARVMADNAYMNASLKGQGHKLVNGSVAGVGGDFSVYLLDRPNKADRGTVAWTGVLPAVDAVLANYVGASDIAYIVVDDRKATSAANNFYQFMVIVDKDFKCKQMFVFDPSADRALAVAGMANAAVPNTGGIAGTNAYGPCVMFEVGYQWGEVVFTPTVEAHEYYNKVVDAGSTKRYPLTGAKLSSASGNYDRTVYLDLLDIVNRIVIGEFGLSVESNYGYMKPSWWEDRGKHSAITVEVAVEPWYAEVTVPPEIEIDPPKTGDAMNILGFVMIALAGLAVVAVRKVRA